MKFIIRRTLLAALLATAFFAGMAVGATNAPTPTAAPTRISTVAAHKAPGWANMLPKSMRRPCATEDSVNCYWNARTMGNGKGHSYIVRKVPGKAGMICVFYIAKRDAKRWDYCS